MKNSKDIHAIVQALKDLYPDGICSLQYQKDYELLFATRLSAQCTDERVNQVTPALFARFPTLEALAEAEPADVEPYIHSCGFFRAKAKDIVFASRMLLEQFHGKVPGTMEELLSCPGWAEKPPTLFWAMFTTPPAWWWQTPTASGSPACWGSPTHQGPRQGGKAAAGLPAAGGVQRLLSPSGAPWPGGLPGAQARLPQLYPPSLVRSLSKKTHSHLLSWHTTVPVVCFLSPP